MEILGDASIFCFRCKRCMYEIDKSIILTHYETINPCGDCVLLIIDYLYEDDIIIANGEFNRIKLNEKYIETVINYIDEISPHENIRHLMKYDKEKFLKYFCNIIGEYKTKMRFYQ